MAKVNLKIDNWTEDDLLIIVTEENVIVKQFEGDTHLEKCGDLLSRLFTNSGCLGEPKDNIYIRFQQMTHTIGCLKFVCEGLKGKRDYIPQIQHDLVDSPTVSDKQEFLKPFIFLQAAAYLLIMHYNVLNHELANLLEEALIFCLIDLKSSVNLSRHCCLLKNVAADILATLVEKSNSHERWNNLIKSLKETFNDKIPSSNHYGAIVTSISLGIDGITEVLPEVLDVYFNDTCYPCNEEDGKKMWDTTVWEHRVRDKLVYACKLMMDYSVENESVDIEKISPILPKIKNYLNYYGDHFQLSHPVPKSEKKDLQPAKFRFFDLLIDEEIMLKYFMEDKCKISGASSPMHSEAQPLSEEAMDCE